MQEGEINYLAYGSGGKGRRVSYFPSPLSIHKALPNYREALVHCNSLKGLASRAMLVLGLDYSLRFSSTEVHIYSGCYSPIPKLELPLESKTIYSAWPVRLSG